VEGLQAAGFHEIGEILPATGGEPGIELRP